MSENLGTVADFSPDAAVMLEDVLRGLALARKNISLASTSTTQRGSELFDAITQQPEYYPTRTEIGILERSRCRDGRSRSGPACG